MPASEQKRFTRQEFIDFAIGQGYAQAFAKKVWKALYFYDDTINDVAAFVKLTPDGVKGWMWLSPRAVKTWELIRLYQAYLAP